MKEYIEKATAPEDELTAKKLRQIATWFTIVNGNF